MPMYEYRCEDCGEEFEVLQPVSARPEDTECPRCHALKATRLMSAFQSRIIGDHKPGFEEMKAYAMLNKRMAKFVKLPPPMGRRVMPDHSDFCPVRPCPYGVPPQKDLNESVQRDVGKSES